MSDCLKKIILVIAILLINKENLTAQDYNDKNKKFQVGVIAPLSGILAEYGLAARNGIEMAKVNRPELFTDTDFIFEDSQWDAKMAVSAFNSLSRIKKVSLIFNWGNPTTEAVAPIAKMQKMPLIGMTLDPKVASGNPFLIRSINPAYEFSAKLADYLKSKKYRKLGVVIAENTYVQGLYDGLKSSLSPDQSVEIIAQHNIADSDFRSTVTKVALKKYDAIGVFLISGQVSTFYRQLVQQKVKTPTFGTDFFESSTEIKLSNGGINGSVYPHLAVSEEFKKEYISKYGNDYQIAYAGNAHDMAVLIGTLFNNPSDSQNSDAILKSLKDEKILIHGVTGDFSFSKTSGADAFYKFPVKLKLIKDNDIVVVD